MNKSDPPTPQRQFQEWLQAARDGNPTALNRFFARLYEKGKASLVQLTKSEEQAEEYFQAAVAKFWLQCVEGEKQLPKSNVEGYIYSIAKFHCIDQMRKQNRIKTQGFDTAQLENTINLSTTTTFSIDQLEQEELRHTHRKVMLAMIKQLSENCQRLFHAILEEGIEKSKELMAHLGFDKVRRVSVLKHECYKRLRVLTAAALEKELINKD